MSLLNKGLIIFDRKIGNKIVLFSLTNIIVELILAGLGKFFIKAGLPNAPSLENIKSPVSSAISGDSSYLNLFI